MGGFFTGSIFLQWLFLDPLISRDHIIRIECFFLNFFYIAILFGFCLVTLSDLLFRCIPLEGSVVLAKSKICYQVNVYFFSGRSRIC